MEAQKAKDKIAEAQESIKLRKVSSVNKKLENTVLLPIMQLK